MKKFTPVLILVLALVAFTEKSVGEVDLADYYPSQAAENLYLDGITISGDRATLWYEDSIFGIFLQFNSAPEGSKARCNSDFLRWLDETLVYGATHHECPGNVETVTVFNPPIVFMPRYWDEEEWSYTGESRIEHSEDGVLVCTGTTSYTSTVEPTESGVYFQTTQTTIWDDFRKCAGWDDTHWQEDYYFGELPGGKGLIRAKGGNIDDPEGRWDIVFHEWETLPKTVNG